MALKPIEQLRQSIKTTQEPLILISENPTVDDMSSAYSFALFLEKQGIVPTVAFSDPFNRKERCAFLKQPKKILHEVDCARDFVLIFNTKTNKIANVRTEKEEDAFRIYITPQKGSIDPHDFSFVPAKSKFDTIFLFGCSDKESVGKIYEQNTDIFYEIPVVNVDYNSNNDSYGQINVVEVVASSTSEIVMDIISEIDKSKLDENIAYNLLAGIISETGSFQLKNTTPRSLNLAAQLIEIGADQQNIVHNLYKAQSLNGLKLWGVLLSQLNSNTNLGLIWAKVTQKEFTENKMTRADVADLLERIQGNYASGKIFMILFQEASGSIQALVKTSQEDMLQKTKANLGGAIKGNCLEVSIQKPNLEEAESYVMSKIGNIQNNPTPAPAPQA